MTFEDLKQVLEEFDMKIRPMALYVHPENMEMLYASIPDIDYRVLVIPTEFVDKGKAILVNRNLQPEKRKFYYN